ncbi:MAG: hypothetical protein KatS3mg110_3366 [Pirellulaceae bacterium]|nr:MAG: hypothetical protein KatS3mg110_3366 [Pirellulaceae bacterium]
MTDGRRLIDALGGERQASIGEEVCPNEAYIPAGPLVSAATAGGLWGTAGEWVLGSARPCPSRDCGGAVR